MLPLKICNFHTIPKCLNFKVTDCLCFFECISNSEISTLNGIHYVKASPGCFQTPSHFQLYCLEIHDKIKVYNCLILIHFSPQIFPICVWMNLVIWSLWIMRQDCIHLKKMLTIKSSPCQRKPGLGAGEMA